MKTIHARYPAFTLIELLTVMAVIAILMAILVPTVGAVKNSAAKARTKVQFAHWGAAIESFRVEYGFYPRFDASGKVNGGADATGDHLFHDILAGRRRDGLELGGAAAAQNRKRINFYLFGANELTGPDTATPELLQDASGHTDIAVLVDRNLDGRIDNGDYPSWPLVEGIALEAADVPSGGLRLAVAFYAPAPGATAEKAALVYSWK